MRQRVFAILITLIVALVAIENSQNIEMFFVTNSMQLSLAVIVIVTFTLGAVAGLLFFHHKRISAELMVKELRRKIVFLETPEIIKK